MHGIIDGARCLYKNSGTLKALDHNPCRRWRWIYGAEEKPRKVDVGDGSTVLKRNQIITV